eukprot:SAG25_NODE_187_length_12399_cov_42.588537_14_plen_108_part_00
MRPVSVCVRVCSACVRVTVLMRVCGCVRAWVRVCLGLASRTAQYVGRLDAPCVRLCARVQGLCIVYVIRCNPVDIMQGGAIYAGGGIVTIDHSLFQHHKAVSSAFGI